MPHRRIARDELCAAAHRDGLRARPERIDMLEFHQSSIERHIALEARIRTAQLQHAVTSLRESRRRAADKLARAEEQFAVHASIHKIDRAVAGQIDSLERGDGIRTQATVTIRTAVKDDSVRQSRRSKVSLQQRPGSHRHIIRAKRARQPDPHRAARDRNATGDRARTTKHQSSRAGFRESNRTSNNRIDRGGIRAAHRHRRSRSIQRQDVRPRRSRKRVAATGEAHRICNDTSACADRNGAAGVSKNCLVGVQVRPNRLRRPYIVPPTKVDQVPGIGPATESSSGLIRIPVKICGLRRREAHRAERRECKRA